MAELTIVFADLTGSTGLFESLGNAKATDVVTRATQWIGKLCILRGGRVIKYLGDGVLLAFDDNQAAVQAMIEMQLRHRERINLWPANMKMKIKVGMARGEVVQQDEDCFGDAVNVAARLSDLSQADQILVTTRVIETLVSDNDIRYRNLGPLNIRGKSEPMPVYRIEWQNEVATDFLTVAGALDSMGSGGAALPDTIELTWLDQTVSFQPIDMPFFIGRDSHSKFMVNDPRGSRQHALIERRGDVFVLSDVSSYGTWVRFAGSNAVISLRRQECVLLDKGEMSLGASFEDFTVPTVSFRFASKTRY
jgi:class 3 adenylate cyclase